MNLALDLEWTTKNPFSRYKLKFQKHQKSFLTREELMVIEVGRIEEIGYQVVRDIFIFSCYTGLSYMDVNKLNAKNIVRGIDGDYWVFTQREKNEQTVKIPLLKKAMDIIHKYKNHPKTNEGSLLPVYSNQKINIYLKEIALKLKIPKNLSFHSARHTFATTVTLSNGVPIETVSKLLGHSKLSTTQLYARVLGQKISDDVRNLKGRLSIGDKLQ